MSTPYNYQDIRDALEAYLMSDKSTLEWRTSQSKLKFIRQGAGHYLVRRRANAAQLALTYMHVFGPHAYSKNPTIRRRVRELAATGATLA